MATQYLTLPQAFDLFADALINYQAHRSRGLDVAQAGAALGVSAQAAQRYEDTITRLMAALKNDEAAPGHAPAGDRPESAHSTP